MVDCVPSVTNTTIAIAAKTLIGKPAKKASKKPLEQVSLLVLLEVVPPMDTSWNQIMEELEKFYKVRELIEAGD